MNNKVLSALMLLVMAACSAPQSSVNTLPVANKTIDTPVAADWTRHRNNPLPKDNPTPPSDPLPASDSVRTKMDTIYIIDTIVQTRTVYDTSYTWHMHKDTVKTILDTIFAAQAPKGSPSIIASLPLNDYLTTVPGTPYPTLKDNSISVDQSKLTNVLNYGAKGDGKTIDDAAIKKAFAAAKYGVLFPTGKTFIVSSTIKQTISNDLYVYAYGATIKKADLSGYGWLDITGNGKQVFWLGGTIDGNQYNQQWFGNPHGGKYNGSMLGHNRLLGGIGLNFFLVKDVSLVNAVMDGFCGESTTLSVFYNCTATNGATFHYNTETGTNGKRETGAGDQGTYYKGRITADNQHLYVIKCTASEGSISEQLSYAQGSSSGETMPHNTLSYTGECNFSNAAQDLIHFEDCYVNIIYNSRLGADNNGKFYQPRIWVSNRTGIFFCSNTDFYNTNIHLGARASMKLAIINGGTFTNSVAYSNAIINGNADYITNASFTGGTVQGYYIKDCYFKNGGKKAISNSKTIANCTFDNTGTGSNSKGLVDLSTFNTYAAVQDSKGNVLGTLNTLAPVTTITKTYRDTSYVTTDTTIAYRLVNDTVFVPVKLLVPHPQDSTAIIPPVDSTGTTDSGSSDGDNIDSILSQTQLIGILPYEKAVSMKLPIARTRIVVSEGASTFGVKQIQHSNILCSPTIVWEKKAFPSDLNKYRTNLAAIAKALPSSKVPFIVIENEPNYQGGDVKTYLQMMQIAVQIFKPLGIEVYTGGFTYPALLEYCYGLYVTDKNDAVVKLLKAAGATAGNDVSVTFIKQYMEQAASYGLPTNFNFHINIAPKTLATLPLVVAKVRQITKGNVLVGECSFSYQKPEDILATLVALKPVNKILLYSEPGGSSNDGLAVSFNGSMDDILLNFMRQAGLLK